MRRIWMVVMFATIIAGIGLTPVATQAGGPYERNDGYEQRIIPRAIYPSARYDGYVREDIRTTYRAPETYYQQERVEVPHYRSSCEKPVLRVKQRQEVICPHCPTPEPVKVTQKFTVNNYYPPKPKKVGPCRIAEPCPTKLQRLKVELLTKRNELEVAQESARANSIERQKMEVEIATWRERDRAQQAYDIRYGEWHKEFQAWQARRPK